MVYNNNDGKETKVVRYSGFRRKQYSVGRSRSASLFIGIFFYCEYLSENRNLYICLADGAIVVFNAVGELRFKYTDPPCLIKEQFNPRCITTDI